MSDRIRVLVVDDSPSTRTMLREALTLDGAIEVVADAGSGREAIDRANEIQPDVVLMDVRMPDGDGVKAARTISACHPTTKIVALTWLDDPSTVREMLAAGAIGYVVKGGTIDELCSAIRRASAGEPELDHRVLPAAVEDLKRLLEQERERREQVERLARTRQEFVQVLSHELRTPLTVISGALRVLERTDVGGNEATLLESALRRVGELEFLVEGLELIGMGPSAEGPAHPSQGIAASGERLGRQPDVVEIGSDRWDGVPDSYVGRVVFELLSNAFRHGQPPVGVSARWENGYGVLRVTDTGGWTAPSDDFAAFFQEDMSSTREKRGFGMGLFVASRLSQACDGGLTVRSENGITVAEARFRLSPPSAP